MAIRTVKVKEGSTTKLVTGVEGGGRILSIRTIKPASFVGCHNRSKSVCLLLLANSQLSYEQGGVLSAKQLGEWSGLSYGSILASVGKWCGWRLIRRGTARLPNGRVVYVYSIAPKGRAWLERHRLHMDAQVQEWNCRLRAVRGFGFFEALAQSPGASTPYARTLDGDHDDYYEDDEEDC